MDQIGYIGPGGSTMFVLPGTRVKRRIRGSAGTLQLRSAEYLSRLLRPLSPLSVAGPLYEREPSGAGLRGRAPLHLGTQGRGVHRRFPARGETGPQRDGILYVQVAFPARRRLAPVLPEAESRPRHLFSSSLPARGQTR